MTGKQLKNSILQWAIQGKLVPQDPTDEPASVLLEKIRQEKERLIKEKKIKRDKNASIIYRGEDNSYYEKILATGEVKCIDEEIPFEIPQGWEWERFGNIMINRDSERIPLSVTQRQHLKKTYDYYGASGVIDKVDKYLFDKDLLLIGEDGANLINRSTPIAFIAKGKYWVNNHAHVLDVCGGMVLSYVALFINAISLVEYVTGTAQPKMNQEKMNSILLAIPPIKEQYRILEKMLVVDTYIDKYTYLQIKLDSLDNSIYELLKKAILQEAIQGKLVPQIAEEGTAQELLEQIQEEKQRLVNEGKLKKSALTSSVIFKGDDNKYYEQIGNENIDITEEIPFDLPYNWTWCRLGNLISITSGENLTSSQMHNGEIPVYGGNGITGYHSKANVFEETIVIGRVGYYCGSIHLTPCQAWVTDNAFITQYSKFLNRDFLIILLTALNLGKCYNATAQPVVSGKKIYPLLIALPPIKEQQRIVAQIEKLFEQLR